MVLLPNCELTIKRMSTAPDATGSYTLRTVATKVPARVEPFKEDFEMQAGGHAVDFDTMVIVDPGTDVLMNDRLEGWNPRNVDPPPELIVRRANDILGIVLPHIEIYADDLRSSEG